MNKKIWIVSLTVICLMLAIPITSTAETVSLSFTTQNPELGWGQVETLKPWIAKIEKEANGKVKFNVYYSQTLAKGPDTWNAVKTGIADSGWCFHGYWSGMTSLSDVVSLPSIPFKTAEEISGAFWKLYEQFPTMKDQYKENHIVLVYTSNPYILVTTKKQVKTMEDIKGLKIRMMGGPSTEQMKALGGVPVSVPMPDNYIAMQKGVTDGMGAPWEAVLSFRLYEVVKYYTEGTPFPAVYFSIAFNQNKWNSLSKDIQDAITKYGGYEGSKWWGKTWFDLPREATIKKAKEAGHEMNIYELTDEERAKWLEVGGRPIWNDWLNKMKEAGHPEAKEILDALLAMK